ncbi:MAG: hypothetical protein JW822_11230 [Spirochaetales bacterium]|nr:hypothetical protein [Spirochaetales bacterium]
MKKHVIMIVLAMMSTLFIVSCPSPGGGGGSQLNLWTWVSGSDVVDQTGSYGDIGVTDPTNMPCARCDSIGWIDADGNLWLFGGIVGGSARHNDLWKYDGANWTWISGSDDVNINGTYGTKGVAHVDNVPGCRSGSISWIDADGNFWLFGGAGYAANLTFGFMNDLWRFDGATWTWISGSNAVNQSGSYGTKGTPDAANIPGARYGGISWIDTDDNLWLLGGMGYDKDGTGGQLNDLWRFDGANWTWISGSDVVNQNGTYGTKGTPAAANVPGSRYYSIGWIDTDDNLWLFGGQGYDSVNVNFLLNDLWKYDGVNWTWISGSDVGNQNGSYGTKGVADAANMPGTRNKSIGWMDSAGRFWLFGGYGRASAGINGSLNDLWKFDGTNWTWVSGSDVIDQSGAYGSKGTADAANIPGARELDIGWIESGSTLWLFGGAGFDSVAAEGDLNDLWKVRVR